MKQSRHHSQIEISGFALLANALGGNPGGDRGSLFPSSDGADFGNGARFIPGEVTLERRAGRRVDFVQDCSSPNCWHWKLSNGTRIFHFDPSVWEALKLAAGIPTDQKGAVIKCENCGNTHTSGGTVNP